MKILLVDGSPIFRKQFSPLLEAAGEAVRVTQSDSLEAASAIMQGERFQVVLLDSNLVDGNGFAIVQSIKAADPRINVIMVGPDASGYHRIAAAKAGADHFFSKFHGVSNLAKVVWQLARSAQL